MESKVEQRTVLRFLTKSGKTPIECWRHMETVFGDQTMSKTRIRVWHKCFLAGRTSFKDDKHTGRPKKTRCAENIQKIRDVLNQDKRKTVHQISAETDIPCSGVHTILKNDLNLSKVAPKVVPKLLTDEQKRFRVRLCQENLDLLRDKLDLMQTVITGDETWVALHEVETKQSSCVWIPKGSRDERPQKAKRQRAERKTMLTTFFDVKGVVHTEFLPPRETVDADLYCDTLRRLKEAVRCKCPHLWGAGLPKDQPRPFLLHHDNASSHTCVITLALIGESNIDMLAHPPYSPDLAPCDFFLFPRLKNELQGHRHRTIADLQQAVRRTLRHIPAEDFEVALMSLPIRWMKCVSAQGEYFEGRHLTVHPEDHGLEVVLTEVSDVGTTDSDSDPESEQEDANQGSRN